MTQDFYNDIVRIKTSLVSIPRDWDGKKSVLELKEADYNSTRMYSFNTAVQRIVLPAISSGFYIVNAQGMVDDGKLLFKRGFK